MLQTSTLNDVNNFLLFNNESKLSIIVNAYIYINFASERMCINELGDGDPPPTN